jgi:hypothetical protein
VRATCTPNAIPPPTHTPPPPRYEPGDVAVLHPRNPPHVVHAIAAALLRPVIVDGVVHACHGVAGLSSPPASDAPCASDVDQLLATPVVVARTPTGEAMAASAGAGGGGPLCGVAVTLGTILSAWLDLTAVPRRVWLEQAALRATDPEQREK